MRPSHHVCHHNTRPVNSRESFTLLLVATFVVLVTTGCCFKGYHLGSDGLYNDKIKTVYVQMVEADTYRDAFGERLTEAICKKITEQTPYRIGTVESADSLLSVRLTSESQDVTAYNRYDDTREKNIKLSASAVWKELHSGQIIAETRSIPVFSSVDGITIESNAYLVAEMGQSTATSQQEAIDKLAEQIVGLMEIAW